MPGRKLVPVHLTMLHLWRLARRRNIRVRSLSSADPLATSRLRGTCKASCSTGPIVSHVGHALAMLKVHGQNVLVALTLIAEPGLDLSHSCTNFCRELPVNRTIRIEFFFVGRQQQAFGLKTWFPSPGSSGQAVAGSK